MDLKYFGTDGVRGVANSDLSPELAFKLGRAGGYVLTQHSDRKQAQVLISRDTRISGEMLESALVAGLLSVGIEVLRLGVVTTPGVAYLVRAQEADAGVMITASHNPIQYNGIKFFGDDGFKLSDEIELEIEKLLDAPVDELPRPSDLGLGRVSDYREGSLKYTQFLEQTIPNDLAGLSIAIDGANGATSSYVSSLFADLNADFHTISTSPDGLNTNLDCGSTHPEHLQKYVVDEGLQMGVAFDGDGDRCIAVDEKGNLIDGDKIMYICGKYLNETGRLKKGTVVTTVMSNLGMYKALERAGMTSVKTKVGDRYVVEEMIKSGYNLGGEQSGHIVFIDHNTTGDGMLTALQLMQVVKQTGKSLSELASEVTEYPQELVNITVADKEAALANESLLKVIAEVEADMAGDGRVLVRPSGTEPLLRIMAEAPTKEAVHGYVQRIVAVANNELV
ncbi:phosphoglucosamine mutase [Paucilactobacillus oligofermentans DSM 15707 = LMG 22743]|uniref:Phosphoglucosamine mutase n=1 Tax=Paucilactobacillus oligofermentans DSM 15707 = LMG 22743 TaxID=1423778 RepID=A0A0R1RM44_9LACO|nr:phosphoglucosamine mutase [Paucilactobacillus oligofermentans]KRL57868.1 phosphoglucosamine mutase [Paucilactobacillus oligofermentans DSM 15707 = LMG 22743]CUS26663.1 Phosphoglucosamine mutase GlmM [Paucilactobacillus oligofermentans DSM 15707 = LMG 22743]